MIAGELPARDGHTSRLGVICRGLQLQLKQVFGQGPNDRHVPAAAGLGGLADLPARVGAVDRQRPARGGEPEHVPHLSACASWVRRPPAYSRPQRTRSLSVGSAARIASACLGDSAGRGAWIGLGFLTLASGLSGSRPSAAAAPSTALKMRMTLAVSVGLDPSAMMSSRQTRSRRDPRSRRTRPGPRDEISA